MNTDIFECISYASFTPFQWPSHADRWNRKFPRSRKRFLGWAWTEKFKKFNSSLAECHWSWIHRRFLLRKYDALTKVKLKQDTDWSTRGHCGLSWPSPRQNIEKVKNVVLFCGTSSEKSWVMNIITQFANSWIYLLKFRKLWFLVSQQTISGRFSGRPSG